MTTTSDDDNWPEAIKRHPEFLTLLREVKGNLELERALKEFFQACEHLPQKELAEVLAYGASLAKAN